MTSEYPAGTRPIRSAFAERDRIQSGLSDGVLVVETDVSGGTMHTVRFALDQGRTLACIDHPERYRWEDKTRGNRKLIEEGCARPVANGDALTGFLNGLKQVVAPEPVAVAEPDAKPEEDADEAQKSFAF